MAIKIIFFGSFQQYSVLILDKLAHHPDIKINGVVTTPPRPGNHGIITKTAVQEYCENNKLSVFPLESLDTIPHIPQPDFIIVAGYGQLINDKWLNFPRYMAINFHPSLLPEYAGRFPVEWAILRNESKTGVSLIKMSSQFDRGAIICQKSITINPTDTKESLYTKLYTLGSDLILKTLPQIISGKIHPAPQKSSGFYARQLTKDDGFFDKIDNTLDLKIRALNPWPGVWTYVYDKLGLQLIMKVFSITKTSDHIELQNVQISGKKPTLWSQISQHYSLTK